MRTSSRWTRQAFPRPARLLAAAALLLAAAGPAPAEPAPRAADAELAFTHALLAFDRGDDGEAERLLRQALEADPGHGTARYLLGLVALRAGDGARAAAEIEAALGASRPPRVERQRVLEDLRRARRLEREREAAGAVTTPLPGGRAAPFGRAPRWEMELGASWGSDSNPALLSDATLALPVDGDPAGLVAGEESETVGQLALRFEIRPLFDRKGWTLGLGVEGHQALYGDLDFLNLSRARGSVQLAWGGDPLGYLSGPLGHARVPFGHRALSLLLQAGITSDRLDGETFSTTVEGAAALTVREGSRLATRLTLAARDEDYEEDLVSGVSPPALSLLPADATETEVGADQFLYFGRRHRYLRLGLAAGSRSGEAAADASLLRFGGEVGLPLHRRLTLWLAGSVEEVDFDGVESHPLFPSFFGDRPRKDTTTRLAAVVSWVLTPRLLLTGRAVRIDREADLGPAAATLLDLDYQRTVVSLGLRWFLLGGGAR